MLNFTKDNMKFLSVLALSLLTLVPFAGAQSVVVTNHKVIYKRPKPISKYKRTFVVNYPRVKAATPAVSRKIDAELSYEKVLDVNIQDEIRETQWLSEANYEVKYNKNGVLAVDLTIDGSGAYPDGSTKSVVVDTATGARVTPATAFMDLDGLAAMVKMEQQKEIAKAVDEIKKDPEAGDIDTSDLFSNADFTAENLDWFSISGRGVIFKYDYGFPHVIEALQPNGEYFFTWAQLKPYIKPGSLLSRVAR
jgi:hypothetical protein